MRIIEESKRMLVVETQGRMTLVIWAVLVPLLSLGLYFGPLQTPGASQETILLGTLGAYAVLLFLAWGPLSDKITVTFHGPNHQVVFSRNYPFGKKQVREFTFEDFDQFEVSYPLDRGFCRLRLKNGKTFFLFRIEKGDDYEALRHLDMIMRKQMETIT